MPKISLGIDPRDKRTAARIYEYIKLRDSSIKKIAKATGIPQSTIYSWLRDTGAAPLGKIRRIYDYLKVPEGERCGL